MYKLKKTKGNTMKNAIASILIFGGIIIAAGSAGDCDGKCMEYANSIGDMLLYASLGLAMMALGAVIALSEKKS
jgi:hypothetical protein